MLPVWAIQINAVSRLQAEAVAMAVTSQGGRVIPVEVIASTGSILSHAEPDFLTDAEKNGTNFIPYGSTKLVELAMELKMSGVFRNDNFSVPIWNEKRADMLNGDSVGMLVKDIPAYSEAFPSDTVVFIRPTVGKKLFPGQPATLADILGWIKAGQVGRYLFPLDMEITIAKNKVIIDEVRWFVVGGKVIDGSAYRVRGQRVTIHDNNENNLKEAQRFADVWLPHPTCVMDLALTEEGLRVIEFNTFNSSGFYHHDIPKIVKAVHDMVGAS